MEKQGRVFNSERLEDRVARLVGPVAEDLGIELVDVVSAAEGGRRILRILIDRPGGVTVGDCERVSREAGKILDVEDAVPGSYCLEVSSPGLDRPLVREKDFTLAVGKKIYVKTKAPIEGRSNFKVTLEAAGREGIVVRDSEGRLYQVEFSNIERARLEVVI
ncbi:MAG: ribosome maturation factor RimP [Deltaproteobacteria bacterium]|nr:ribosome maturation factor RimP [Deltaproteobacteria bacterium]